MLVKLDEHINIRTAQLEDMIAITAIYNQAIDLGYVTADTDHVTVKSHEENWKTITQIQHRPFWVALQNEKIVGFFYFRNFYDRPAYRITAEIGIYLDKNARGDGLGFKILNFCMAEAPKLGIENILALIFASNKNSLILFEKAGFEKNGEFLKIAKAENGYNDLIMLQKKI